MRRASAPTAAPLWCDGRVTSQTASAAIPTTTTKLATPTGRCSHANRPPLPLPPIARRVVVVRICRAAVAPSGSPISSVNAAAVCGRSAGTLPSTRWIASSTSSGTALRITRMLGTGAMACCAMIAIEFFPLNGGTPASISYSMQPSE